MRLHVLALGSVWTAGFVTSAQAQVTETSTIQNSYRYVVGGRTGAGSNSGGITDIFESVNGPQGISEMGLSLTGTLDNGSFLFLHDGTCVGTCSLTLVTDIVFTLFNSGDTPVDLRFDSQITPGHLANSLLDPGSGSQANFLFSVSQDPGLRQNILYSATGDATVTPPSVTTTDGSVFNGFNIDNNAPLWTVADWSATNLSIGLATIDPGQTSNLYYRSTLTLSTFQVDCPDPTQCQSFQVAFGDPRNSGGIINNSALAGFDASAASTVIPAVGAPFDPFRVSYQFVSQGSPQPSQPPVIGPISYGVNYGSRGAVPEPSTWALLIIGFGFSGAALRRRIASRHLDYAFGGFQKRSIAR